MKVQINISVRNPDWYWKEDDYQETWIAINGDKEAKYLLSVTFGFDVDITEYVKPELDQHTFKFKAFGKDSAENPQMQEVILNDLDITQFRHAEGSIHVIVSKSILHHVMAAQNNGAGKFYWYYFIKEGVEYVEVERNVWLSREHFDELRLNGLGETVI